MLTEKQSELVSNSYKNRIIERYAKYHKLNLDDWHGILAIGLCNAAKTYDPSKASFNTWAWMKMKQSVTRERRSLHTAKNITTEQIYSLDEQYDMPQQLIQNDTTKELENRNDFKKKLKEKLSDVDYEIMIMFDQGYSVKEISHKFNIAQSTVYHRRKIIRSVIKDIAKENEWVSARLREDRK